MQCALQKSMVRLSKFIGITWLKFCCRIYVKVGSDFVNRFRERVLAIQLILVALDQHLLMLGYPKFSITIDVPKNFRISSRDVLSSFPVILK